MKVFEKLPDLQGGVCLGRVVSSEFANHWVRMVDDANATGGYLIYTWWDGSDGPNENHAFDGWVETWEDLEAYFQESGWSVDWRGA